MRITLTVIVFAASPAAAQDGIFVALSGDLKPSIHRVNPHTGAVVDTRPVAGHQYISGGLARSADPGIFYAIDGFDDILPDRLVRIDLATGVATVVGSTGFNWSHHSIGFNSFPDTLYVIGDNAIYTLNTSTGQATFVANLSGSVRLDQVTAISGLSQGIAFITDTDDCDFFQVSMQNGQVEWRGSLGDSQNPFVDFASGPGTPGVRKDGNVYDVHWSGTTQTLLFPGEFSGLEYIHYGYPYCYVNCDKSTAAPTLTANDFVCFLMAFNSNSSLADCDTVGGLTASDFFCFIQAYNQGCS
jgi:outer membrane protein assembly factor BamB